MPVTQTEVPLRDNTMIVSRTDLKGRITYINRDFVEISGFSEQELIGEPHNIVRHPDMPPEAYLDLWNTLKAGRPWTGMVKNRCKNGDYYWVVANATPLFEGGQVVGYMSVRVKPTREQVSAAEEAYRLFREKRASGMAILHGQVVLRRRAWLRKIADSGLSKRLSAGLGALLVLLLLVGGLGLYNMKRSNELSEQLYDGRVTGLANLLSMQNDIGLARLQLVAEAGRSLQALRSKSAQAPADVTAAVAHLDGADKTLQAYRAKIGESRHKALVEDVAKAQSALLSLGLRPLAAGIQTRQEALLQQALTQLPPLSDKLAKALDTLRNYETEAGKAQLADMRQVASTAWAELAIGVVLFLVIAALFSVWLLRSSVRPLQDVISLFRELASGNFRNTIDISRNDETGRVMQGLQSLQVRLGFEVAETRRVSEESTRVRVGLDNVTTNVMIADSQYNIIYMNKALVQMMTKAETDIRKSLPNFSVATLLGANIDVFHKNPSHQRGLLDRLTTTYRSKVQLGGHTFMLTVTPVINDRQERLGTAVEWADLTDELLIESEVEQIVEKAARGHLSDRIKLEGKEGFVRNVSVDFNMLLDRMAQGFGDLGKVLSALATGDLRSTIESQYEGELATICTDANACVEHLREIVTQIKSSADTINTAAGEIAAGNSDLSGRTEEQASSLEQTAASMEQLTGTVKQNADNARQASQLASSASDIAQRGGEMVARVVTTMSSISDSSKKIADIIGVIDGIAFQTNILALNAAVEAARAGEQGRGFAVVASEVRSLAQRSAAAAKEIKELIQDSVSRVNDGHELVVEAGGTMTDIVGAVQRVRDIINEIAHASSEQSDGIDQVGRAITQMDEVTQQNAALVEQAAASAESLEDQARSLVGAVAMFKLGDEGTLPLLQPPAKQGRARAVAKASPAKAPARLPKAVPPTDDGDWEEF
ncbi:methyl-accepting chemotaxis protein [Chitinivorax sp. PXF-14]|uniref:methyl-accepting chemotaxis protein n=1 Tax=Chitinivorax sp. PXF-14 TaxID=3230488 RepID=UPI003465EE47